MLFVPLVRNMGSFNEYEELIFQKLQKINEKKVVSLQESHDRLHREFNALSNIFSLLKIKNGILEDQLKTNHT